MAHITAIELDGDACAIARTTVRGRGVTVSAADVLNPTSFPGPDAFAAALRKARRTLHLPRRSRVVLWGLPDGATPKDPGAASALAPLTAAGFKVDRVVTPCNALGALARLKSPRGDDATCWVAINTGSVAIAVIRPGRQLYARAFGWNSTVGSSGSQARLLQRYSLVSFLSPEIKRAMTAAQAAGYPVRAVVTCGNLPELRSMTMPLIEELDVEVETLDSFDGLDVNPAPTERLMEIAAALRLACAGAVARRTRPWDDSKRIAAHRAAALGRVAAAIAILAAVAGGFMASEYWRPRNLSPAPVATAPVVPERTPAPELPSPPPSAAREDARADRGSGSGPGAQPITPAAETERPPAHTGSDSAPLTDPLPRVTAVLVSNDRRFATIDRGRVVGVGDRIGRRVVAAIDEGGVVLREPSGRRVRVPLAGRTRAPKPTAYAAPQSM